MISLNHAKAICHHYCRLLGIDREANAHPTFDHMHRDLDERGQKRKLVELVDKMRGNAFVEQGDQGKLLLEFASHLAAELAAEGG